MSTVYEIPLNGTPQKFVVALGSTKYTLTVKWNAYQKSWYLDIADVQNKPIVGGIPLVTGVDLLAQYAYLNIGGKLIVQTSGNKDAVPTFDNLGSASHLFFVVS